MRTFHYRWTHHERVHRFFRGREFSATINVITDQVGLPIIEVRVGGTKMSFWVGPRFGVPLLETQIRWVEEANEHSPFEGLSILREEYELLSQH